MGNENESVVSWGTTETSRLAAREEFVDIVSANRDRSGIGLERAADRAEERRLPSPVRSDEADELPGLDREETVSSTSRSPKESEQSSTVIVAGSRFRWTTSRSPVRSIPVIPNAPPGE